ncbi:MAG TPA: hypothetical protein VFC46_12695, partial [Humisphaera sp.]|nr:hypothetical protein [Humisphaera sp.]
MKFATLLIIVLSHQGYWIAGQPATIALRPAVKGQLAGATLSWELKFDGVRLGAGKGAIAGGDKPTEIGLVAPEARVRIALNWHYRLLARDGTTELETGDVPISVFPNDLLDDLASRVGPSRLIVWDEPGGLPKLLDAAKVPYSRVSGPGQLQIASADVVLVGQKMLNASPFEQSPLLNLAQSGVSVMIFQQDGPEHLIGYPLARRLVPSALDWRTDHPLLIGLDADDLRSWLATVPRLGAAQLPLDEPTLVIAGYPPEVAGEQPAPIDAVMLTKSVGKGRIVLCQIPLGDWSTDPRSQILLANAIDYLLTRPQPTPRPSERRATRTTQTKMIPN